jgi:hypothetical protein
LLCCVSDTSITTSLIPIPYTEDAKVDDEDETIKVIEIVEDGDVDEEELNEIANASVKSHSTSVISDQEDNYNDISDSKNDSVIESGDSSSALKDILDTRAVPNVLCKEAPYNFISPDDLTLSMHKMNMSCVVEENDEEAPPVNKKKSPTKVRVKSPYENKSHIIEEKKRKRLLEIREKREKRKIAMSESCKIAKHRYGKGPIMPQQSSSVTKLSITNKSFYNSIYGQNANILDKQPTKCKPRKVRRDLSVETRNEQFEDEQESPLSTPDKNSKKYINRSYYLDDAVTEMMYTQQSDCSSEFKELFSASTSMVSNEIGENNNMIPKQTNALHSDSNIKKSCDKLEM